MPKFTIYSCALVPMWIKVEAENEQEATDIAASAKMPKPAHQAFIHNGKGGTWYMESDSIETSDEPYLIDEEAIV